MRERGALIVVFIMERPLCVACIASKSGLTSREVESYLASIQELFILHRAVDRCRDCGTVKTVCSFLRRI